MFRPNISLSLKALLIALLCLAPANAQMSLTGAGGTKKATAAAAYTGPLDIISSATWCYSLRACSSSLRGTKVVNACNSTGGTDVGCADLLSDASTGLIVPATVGGITCPGANCTIKTWYDQTSGGNCTGSCDLVQATIANRYLLVASCLGSLPCAQSNGTTFNALMQSAGVFAQSQPLSISIVAEPVANSLPVNNAGSVNPISVIFLNSSAVYRMHSPTDVSILGVSTSTWSNILAVYNDVGTGSFGYANGTSTAAAPGTNGFSGAKLSSGGTDFFGTSTINIVELIDWGAAESSTNATNLCHNQFTFWGTSTSC